MYFHVSTETKMLLLMLCYYYKRNIKCIYQKWGWKKFKVFMEKTKILSKKLCSGNGFIHCHKTVIHYSSMASLTSLQQLDLSVRLCL